MIRAIDESEEIICIGKLLLRFIDNILYSRPDPAFVLDLTLLLH